MIYALMHVDFLHLYPVNLQTLSQFRKAFYPSGAKDDPIDADLLLEILMSHCQHLRLWVPDDVLTRSLQLLTEDRRRLYDRKASLFGVTRGRRWPGRSRSFLRLLSKR